MKKIIFGALAFIGCLFLGGCDNNTNSERHEYTDVYKNISVFLATVENKTTTEKSMSIVESDYFNTTNYVNVRGTAQSVYFISKLYENNHFPIIEDPVKFTANYTSSNHTQQNELSYFGSIDKDNNKVIGNFYGTCIDSIGSSDGTLYVYIDIDYNFDSSKVEGYTLFGMNVFEGTSSLWGEYYSDGIMKSLVSDPSNETRSLATSYYDNCLEKNKNAYSNNLDFSKEYTDSMNQKL